MEHRIGHRVVTDVPVRVALMQAAVGWGRVLNVSATGAFMRTPLRLPILSIVRVEPTVEGRAGWPLDPQPMAACVVWSNNAGLGLEWCEPSEQLVENLINSWAEASSALSAARSATG